MEYLKDYDFKLLYHPRKANVSVWPSFELVMTCNEFWF